MGLWDVPCQNSLWLDLGQMEKYVFFWISGNFQELQESSWVIRVFCQSGSVLGVILFWVLFFLFVFVLTARVL